MLIKKSIELSGKTLSIETGKMAKQAGGAVVVRFGDTMVLVTAVAAEEENKALSFFPLTVEYREKTFSAGKIPGGFIKREGRPSEKEILSARLIDRPIRPLFPDAFNCETQIITNVLSMDKENDSDVLAALGASMALCISDIPFAGPIATVRVARIEGEYVINPTITELAHADIELVVAGSDHSIMMVEGEAKEVSEADLFAAINAAHEAIKKLIQLQNELLSELTVEKRIVEEKVFPEGFIEKVHDLALPGLQEAVQKTEKTERRQALRQLQDSIIEQLAEEFPESEADIKNILHELEKKEVRSMMLSQKRRLDGRGFRDIREISCEVGILPRTHGSALFTRGQTQVLGIVTLGTKADEQIVDALEGESSKKYLLHYNFPPFCTGEAKPIRGVSRREVGHGNLAERALKPVLPVNDKFPYTIRIVAEVLESNGSSSMATVCAGSLSLMDAGIPIQKSVAGIAMGLIKEGDDVAILSDILGDEDHLGDMDFKIAGTRDGITAVQMDIKLEGIPAEIMEQALQQAKEGRLHIMGKMDEVMDKPREELSRWAPRIEEWFIPVDKIGTVIGPGGKIIRGIIEKTGVEINIDDLGKVSVASPDVNAVEEARRMIDALTEEAQVGKAYKGVVKRVKDFGCFVEFMPGKEGMVHISELELSRTNKVSDVVNEGDTIDVVVKGIGNDGKISLSRREFLKRQKSLEQEQ